MTGVVCDASVIVALLVDEGADGEWVADAVRGHAMLAPDLMPFETANVIRRLEQARIITPDVAAQVHNDLMRLPVGLWPYELLGHRVWELRGNLSAYDASYVALAEATGVPLVTLDQGIAAAPGLRCEVATPTPG